MYHPDIIEKIIHMIDSKKTIIELAIPEAKIGLLLGKDGKNM